MDYAEIARLNRMLPELEEPPANVPFSISYVPPAGLMSITEHRRFIAAYDDPAFGWTAADTLYRGGVQDFPIFPSRSSQWVHRAWMLLRFGSSYRNDPRFEPVLAAHHIYRSPQMTSMRQVIEAALITQEQTPQALGIHLGMDGQTIEAYDALFFNVYDRKADLTFLRNIVYPYTRLEELVEEYLIKGNLGKQLMRIGYNKGLAAVLYFAGFRIDLLPGVDVNTATEMFKHTVMLQGRLLADNGFLNFTRPHASLSGARSIVTANMIGGNAGGGEVGGATLAEAMHLTVGGISARMREAVEQLADRN